VTYTRGDIPLAYKAQRSSKKAQGKKIKFEDNRNAGLRLS